MVVDYITIMGDDYKKPMKVDDKYFMSRENIEILRMKIIGLDKPSVLCKKLCTQKKPLTAYEEKIRQNIRGF